ncbi:2'-5' RNA ligase family protein [Tessaracoccus antarcticus]|uniref:2'-5' RNA ligase family protein n=1 Tax=Tessaracoccus antarcticus TaxID=2479848 RepID=A0A3M0GBU0_9ACTN|nr:2'-5' RNA ligase family protein [Tessaracoccus antarcticus]RMB61867.1 2'-5' RNA ligase family protein [Tessaracoccus antarcticus]
MTPFTHTISCQDRDFPEWHGGRTHALVWALELRQPDVGDVVTSARARLDGLLLPRYERQPHVTVAFGGLAGDDGLAGYGGERLANDLSSLRPLLEGPLEVSATGWGSFPMVPYLAVESPWLPRAHQLLDHGATEHGMTYLPHVTLGHWAGEWRRDDVLDRLDAPLPTRSWSVGELSLLRYETHDIAGRLEPVGRLDLTHGTWRTVLDG